MPWSVALPQAIFAHPLVSVVTPITTGSLIGYHTNRELAPTPQGTIASLTYTRERQDEANLPLPQEAALVSTHLALSVRLDRPLWDDGLCDPPRNCLGDHCDNGFLDNRTRLGGEVTNTIYLATGVESPMDAPILHATETGVGAGGYLASGRECCGVDAYLVEA